jgi:transcriptional regulator GlxA family with amidase domain
MDWMRANLAEPLTVERLADAGRHEPAQLRPRLRRRDRHDPAKAVERLRLEAARTEVETGRTPIDRVAESAGFGDPERMRRAFLRAFGQPPQALRRGARA